MSDESSPPPLRLRPRARSEGAATTPPPPPAALAPPAEPLPPPATPSEPSPAAEPFTRLRLKPKLMADAEPEAAKPAPLPASVPVPSPVIQPAAMADFPPPAPSVESAEMPRLKLKPLTGVPASVEAPPQPIPPSMPVDSGPAFPPAPRPAPPPVPPPVPPVAPPPPLIDAVAPLSPSAMPLKPLPVLKLDPSAPAGVLEEVLISPPPPTPFKPPVQRSSLSGGRILAIAVVLLVAGVGGYFAYDAFLSNSSKSQVAVVIPEKKPTTPAGILPPTSQPQRVVAPVQPPKPTPPVVPVPLVIPTPVAVPKPVVPAQPPVHAAVAPSIDFLTWIDTVKISGLVNGATPRAIINGLLVRPGDTIDSARGIVFDHLDSEHKQIYFRDRSGAETSKSY